MDKYTKADNKPISPATEPNKAHELSELTELKDSATATPKGSWDHIESDLKNALNSWSELTDTMANKLPPDEEKLRDIKNILSTLKDQLKEFSDDSVPPDTQEKP